MEQNPYEIINELLGLQLRETVRGDAAKGICPDSDGPGVVKLYLYRTECETLAQAFADLAKKLSA